MVKNNRIVLRVSEKEHELFRNNAESKGFSTVSDFVRDFGLRNPLGVEQKVAEIQQAVLEIKSKLDFMAQAPTTKNISLDSLLKYMPPMDYITQQTEPSGLYRPNPAYKPDPIYARDKAYFQDDAPLYLGQ
ncbi:MAG: hypothetical protein AABX78_02295 [Nanoarchaeota archaeon]